MQPEGSAGQISSPGGAPAPRPPALGTDLLLSAQGSGSETDEPPLSGMSTASRTTRTIRAVTTERGAACRFDPESDDTELAIGQCEGDRERRFRRWSHWRDLGLLLVLGGVALFVIGVLDAGQLSALGYLLVLVGAGVLTHAGGMHRSRRARITSRRRRSTARWH